MNIFSRSLFLLLALFIGGCGSSSSSKPDAQSVIPDEDVPEEVVDSSVTCESLNEEPVHLSVEDFSVMAGDTDYKLYFEDFLNALQAADSEALTSEEQSALTAILSKINEHLGYEMSEGRVTRANNPLDYLEQIIFSSTSPGPIQEAKEMLAALIQNDGNRYCSYQNRDIIISDLQGNFSLAVQLDLILDPFYNSFKQAVLLEENSSNLDNSRTNLATRYFSFFEADHRAFSDNGFTPPLGRFAGTINTASNESLFIEEFYSLKKGVAGINFENSYCDQQTEGSDPSNYSECAKGIQTRVVQKEQCDGSHEGDVNEVNKVALHSFDMNSSLTNIKRLRIETDYASDQVKVFASDYIEAILDSDGITVIKDPTLCEKQAIIEELAELKRNIKDVRLTLVPDPNYDGQYLLDENGALIKDDDGEAIIMHEPVPAIQYLGSSVTSRK